MSEPRARPRLAALSTGCRGTAGVTGVAGVCQSVTGVGPSGPTLGATRVTRDGCMTHGACSYTAREKNTRTAPTRTHTQRPEQTPPSLRLG